MLTADAIRKELTCPRCGRKDTIRAQRVPDAEILTLRLACSGKDGLEACGVLGAFVPENELAWSYAKAPEAISQLQSFLAAVEPPAGDGGASVAFAKHTGDRIAELEREVRQIARMVHLAYHVGVEPDVSAVEWDECGMATCLRAQAVLGMSPSA